MLRSSPSQCTLPYPDRFDAAVRFLESCENQEGGSKLSNETRLILYALQKQGTLGACNEPRPSSWSLVENAKWQTWKHLGNMAKFEAMHKFVRTLEEDYPDWWLQLPPIVEREEVVDEGESLHQEPVLNNGIPDHDADHSNGGDLEKVEADAPLPNQTEEPPHHPSTEANGKIDPPPVSLPDDTPHVPPLGLAEQATLGSWVVTTTAPGPRPLPRYEHAAVALLNKLYVFGGCGVGSRHLADVWVLDLLSMVWQVVPTGNSTVSNAADSESPSNSAVVPLVKQPSTVLPPCAGHVAVRWHNKVLIIGGRLKTRHLATDQLVVRTFDAATHTFGVLGPLSGEAPPARGGHSATLIGNCLYVFGGEDAQRRSLNDLWVLDLDAMAWLRPAVEGNPPSPRSAHSACVVDNRHLLIFGGGSGAACYNDLAALDSSTMTWSQLGWRGPAPTMRAGHSGATMGDKWYIAGGGNMLRGCADMLSIDLSPVASEGPLSWTTVCTLPPRSPVCSEGLSVLALPAHHQLLAFGGYNGEYNSAVSVYQVPEDEEGPEPPSDTASVGNLSEAPTAPLPDPPPSPLQRLFSRGDPMNISNRSISSLGSGEGPALAPSAAAAALDAAWRDLSSARDTITLLQRQVVTLKQELSESERQLVEARAKLQAEQLHHKQTASETVMLRHKLMTLEQGMADVRTQLDEERRVPSKGSGIFSWGAS